MRQVPSWGVRQSGALPRGTVYYRNIILELH